MGSVSYLELEESGNFQQPAVPSSDGTYPPPPVIDNARWKYEN